MFLPLIDRFGQRGTVSSLEISKKTEPFLALPLRTDFDYFSSPQIEHPLGLDIGKSSWIRLIVKARMFNFY
jgi:hypothetical protein